MYANDRNSENTREKWVEQDSRVFVVMAIIQVSLVCSKV